MPILPRHLIIFRDQESSLFVIANTGIVFRDGPAGRRPGLAAYGLDVWEVVETIQNEDGNPEAAAAYLGIRRAQVNAALDYYLDYPDEIDRWIELNRTIAEDAEAAWRRRQSFELKA